MKLKYIIVASALLGNLGSIRAQFSKARNQQPARQQQRLADQLVVKNQHRREVLKEAERIRQSRNLVKNNAATGQNPAPQQAKVVPSQKSPLANTNQVQKNPVRIQQASKAPQKMVPAVQVSPQVAQKSQPQVSNDSQVSTLGKELMRIKAGLNRVPERDKNNHGKMVLAQRAPFYASSDIEPFIKKLATDTCCLVNNTARAITLEIDYQAKDAQKTSSEKVRLLPKKEHQVTAPEQSLISAVKLVGNATAFVNPTFTEQGQLKLIIDKVEDRFFLHQYHEFDFSIKNFTGAELHDSALSEEDRKFRHDFNGSVGYLDFVGHEEGTSKAALEEQRKSLYAQNNIAQVLKHEPGLLDSTVHRIPLVTHKIWVTSDDKPTNPSPQYIKWLESSIANNNLPSDGWTHYFWIENKAKLPELAALLSNHPTIVLRELDELDTSEFFTGDLYKSAIKERKFGKASDIIRLELLRKFGGFYLDTDYELFQSLVPYAKAYDMVVGLEPMSVYLCNAFIGSCPNHPVLNKALAMIKRNLGMQPPAYIAQAENNGFKTIIETGPAMFTIAFGLAGGSKEYRDIVLPPQLIYPAQSGNYPERTVVVPNGKMPAESIGAHYWNTAWMDPRFGSRG